VSPSGGKNRGSCVLVFSWGTHLVFGGGATVVREGEPEEYPVRRAPGPRARPPVAAGGRSAVRGAGQRGARGRRLAGGLASRGVGFAGHRRPPRSGGRLAGEPAAGVARAHAAGGFSMMWRDTSGLSPKAHGANYWMFCKRRWRAYSVLFLPHTKSASRLSVPLQRQPSTLRRFPPSNFRILTKV